MGLNEYRKWVAIGSGVGIEIGDRDLDVALVRVRPSGAETLGALRIERFASRPAAEWSAEYTKFLKHHGVPQLAATVLLPRSDVIVRQLAMPGVAERDLSQAIAFQLDGLHPFSEDEAVNAWARMDDGTNVLVGVTRREVIHRYTGLFAEAGIKVASFTFSAAVIYGSLRMFGAPPAGGFLAFADGDSEVEAYGESDARPLFSATFDTPAEQFGERARSMAISELRLPEDTPTFAVSEILPKPKRVPQGFELAKRALPYATAIVAACPRLGLHVNLLPPELRVTTSRMMFVPTIVLGSLLLIGAGSLMAYSSYQDRQYLDKLRAEIARLEPDARKPLVMDRAIEQARARTLLLDQFRRRTRDDLDALAELTKIIEPPAFLNSAEIARDSIRISGEAAQAAGLLKTVDKSLLFEGSEHAAPMTRTQTGEIFSIRARREGLSR
jgi:hypothetical protein